MIEDYKKDCHKDIGYVYKEKPKYREIEGFNHIWTYFKKKDGNYICSKYTREKKNALYIASITNSPEGWVVHLFYGGIPTKSWFSTYTILDEAVEHCIDYLEGKLDLK